MSEQDLSMRRRFEDLLPWYVNGTIDAAEAEWVAAYLRDHPDAAGELRWHESLQRRVQENVPAVPAEIGFDKLLQRIRAEQPAARAVVGPSLGERVRDFFAGFGLTPKFAVAGALIVVQAGFIGKLMLDQRELEAAYSEVRSTAGQLQVGGTLIRVSFKADARESDIRLLLVAIGATVVDGPSQLGDYVVKVASERTAMATEQLAANPVVESAAVLGEARR